MITDGSHPSHMDPDPAQTPSSTALQSTTQQPWPSAATTAPFSTGSFAGISAPWNSRISCLLGKRPRGDRRSVLVTEVESWTPPPPAVPSSALATGTSDEFRGLLAAFLLRYEGNTRTAYARDLADWLKWLHRHDVEALDARRVHVDAYARELAEVRALAPATVARRLAALAGFYAC